MNLKVKSITTATFTPEELEKIKNRGDYKALQSIFMEQYSDLERLKFPIPDGSNPAYMRTFLSEKYYKRRWFSHGQTEQQPCTLVKQSQAHKEASESSKLNQDTTDTNNAKESKASPHDYPHDSDSEDIKYLNNPFQFKKFGSYQNVHLQDEPDTAIDPITKKPPPVTYSFDIPTTFVQSTPNTPPQPDPYAALKSPQVAAEPSLFTRLEEEKKVQIAQDPYAAFRFSEPNARSIFDSASTFVDQSTCLPTDDDNEFGDFLAPVVIATTPSSASSKSKDNEKTNLLNVGILLIYNPFLLFLDFKQLSLDLGF